MKDGRHESVVKTQMCGLLRNGFGKAIGIMALKNQETLGSILAYSIADSLEFAGYEIVQVYPERLEQLSSVPRGKPKGMKADIKLAKKSQPKTARSEAKTLRDLGEFGEGVSLDRTSGNVTALGGNGWTNGADAILEVTIDRFSTDYKMKAFTIDILGWSAVTLTVAPGESAPQGTLAVTEARGWGELETGMASKKTFKRVADQSYRRLVNKMETVFLSDEFFTAMAAAGGAATQTD